MIRHREVSRQREGLELDSSERIALRFGARGHMVSTGLGVVSLMLVWLIPHQPAFAGMIYGLMGPLHAWNGYGAGRAKARLSAPGEHPSEHPAQSTEHPPHA